MTPVQDLLEHELEVMERAWNDGSFEVVAAAVKLCTKFSMPLPPWVERAVIEALSDVGGGRRGRLARQSTADREKNKHYVRWDAVRELRERKAELAPLGYHPTWEAAYEHAAKALRDTPFAGSPDAIKKSYQLVERLFKSDKGARFYRT